MKGGRGGLGASVAIFVCLFWILDKVQDIKYETKAYICGESGVVFSRVLCLLNMETGNNAMSCTSFYNKDYLAYSSSRGSTEVMNCLTIVSCEALFELWTNDFGNSGLLHSSKVYNCTASDYALVSSVSWELCSNRSDQKSSLQMTQ